MFQERMRRCASTVLGIQGMILLCYLGVARCWNFHSTRNQYAAGLRGCSTEEPFAATHLHIFMRLIQMSFEDVYAIINNDAEQGKPGLSLSIALSLSLSAWQVWIV